MTKSSTASLLRQRTRLHGPFGTVFAFLGVHAIARTVRTTGQHSTRLLSLAKLLWVTTLCQCTGLSMVVAHKQKLLVSN
ncbi:MAG: hypothetical protein P8N76_05805 [Pirellulaceae bacterium]|nr:hypothetical protein [Pirellulaceae bacterium]